MFTLVFETRDELYEYLNNVDFSKYKTSSMSSVYFLVKYKDGIEPLYFMPYEGVYFESPCCLMETFEEKYIEDYVKGTYIKSARKEALKYEKSMCRNGMHYEIDCPQCAPFLKGPMQIIQILSEQECLDYLLNQRNLEKEGR